MSNTLETALVRKGYHVYPKSIREIGRGAQLCVVNRDGDKFVGLLGRRLDAAAPQAAIDLGSGDTVAVYELSWEVYRALSAENAISPVPCDGKSSFGTGDRMGMVTAAHIEADSRYPVFPILAQQSPRELERTERSFKSVLLDAVMGVLEAGYEGNYGADADHIKDERRFSEGVEAGYSMYTVDVSDDLRDISGLGASDIQAQAEGLAKESRDVIGKFAGSKLLTGGGVEYVFSEEELTKSALIYEKSMMLVEKFRDIAKSGLPAFDLEVSIDEGGRDTTPEDHLYVAEYLHARGVDFTSLAPRFPGEFQKAVDYMGDAGALTNAFAIHAQLARDIGGYRLSLHSGSDKFSVYKTFAEATEGHFHVKTSGTSWLRAVELVANADPVLFADLYDICVKMLPESKKAYHVYITPESFPARPSGDLLAFFAQPDVQQLFHISYGALLDARKADIVACLKSREAEHYQCVTRHIDNHLKLLF